MALVLMHHRVTFAELSAWPEAGRRYELYDGEVREVPAPMPRHQLAMFELAVRLRTYVRGQGGVVLVSPIDIVFDDTNVLQPDIVVFTAARKHVVDLDRVVSAAPDVAVEVLSPGTAGHDRGRKLRWFERFGVQEYWLLDPAAESIEIRSLVAGRYVLMAEAGRGDSFGSSVLAGFSCAIDALL